MFLFTFAYTSWRNLKRILSRENSLKIKKKNSAVPALFFHTMLIIFEYIVQMVGCIFAKDFFSSQVHRHDLEFVMLYSCVSFLAVKIVPSLKSTM
jgi:hypothetical protein